MTKKEKAAKRNKIETPKDNKSLEASAAELEADETAGYVDEDYQEKLKQSEKKAHENHENFLRKAAELENYKKRTTREMSNLRKFAIESFAGELLTVVDNLERALDSSTEKSNTIQSLVQGIDMTFKGFLEVLNKHQVAPIESIGKPFDPAFHQAVSQQESNQEADNTVLLELQKGYMIHDRLLRPAMVVVSKRADISDDK